MSDFYGSDFEEIDLEEEDNKAMGIIYKIFISIYIII